ncbi:translation initiation factor IF-2-like isoform X1 [Canis lupus dingo]|uniref:translation initiation factor IF-2-like isoform X1 n=1 Tax=Canis lupus dingo TaxID=286419 RepID=UPI0020C383FA|nr:translation initiation factor IF-2-like isoform X1 [Canis lupus dingo]
MAARDRETVAPEAGAGGGLPGRSATPQPEYGPSPGTRPWLRRRQSPVEAPAARALLPPPAASRGFHAGSADVPPRPRPAGRRRGGAAWRRRAVGNLRVAGRRGAGPLRGGPPGFRTRPSRRPVLTFPVQQPCDGEIVIHFPVLV